MEPFPEGTTLTFMTAEMHSLLFHFFSLFSLHRAEKNPNGGNETVLLPKHNFIAAVLFSDPDFTTIFFICYNPK